MTYGKDGKDGNLLAESLDAQSASGSKYFFFLKFFKIF